MAQHVDVGSQPVDCPRIGPPKIREEAPSRRSISWDARTLLFLLGVDCRAGFGFGNVSRNLKFTNP